MLLESGFSVPDTVPGVQENLATLMNKHIDVSKTLPVLPEMFPVSLSNAPRRFEKAIEIKELLPLWREWNKPQWNKHLPL